MPEQRTPASRSWQVTAAAFQTPLLACVLILVILSGGEIVARLPIVRAALHAPSVGSPSRRFELQLDSLERYAAVEPVDCLVLGNSTALMGVDPEAMGRAYLERSGRRLHCFNFGVAGMTASAAGAIAPILVERYRPWLLIQVLSARDLGQSVDGPLLANTAWVQYQQGSLSTSGWLADHSAAFGYYLLYRQWLDPLRWPAAASPAGTTAQGFFAMDTHLPLSPALWAHTQRAYAGIVSQLLSQPESEGLARLVALQRGGTQIVLVEAPAHEKLRHWGRQASSFYEDAIAQMRQAARREHAPFWRVPTSRIIPADAWTDFVHLDRNGAGRFSQWLGVRLGNAVESGRLKPPPRVAK